ncbi:MAG: M23 family metallopeptidase [Prevotellaceae bacterium]|jgi:hypothetical protein|nr:M23 family metallopeptidase [Prevotellaceae bacterium]
MLACILLTGFLQSAVFLPINAANRHDASTIQLTEIGAFGILRKARPGVPAHYHTGIDVKRPNGDYDFNPVYPVAEGVVISKRTDGPYANLIIEHTMSGKKIWSLYEHIAGINVGVGDRVGPTLPVARFMNRNELNRYGWQFDHFHLEILKVQPLRLQPTAQTPERFYNSYSLVCYTKNDLEKYYHNPMLFLRCR